ncbi:MAG: 50S ribosomal protein L4 [Thermoanaerobaculia bacterium]
MKIAVKNLENRKVRDLELPEEVFSYPYKEHLIHTVVQAYLAGLRAGTHKTKTRAEVSGSGKKLWKQKGTGRARVGSIRSPLWRHGGTTQGPRPRDYAQDVSAREKKNALKSALSRKLKEERFIVVDQLAVPSPKTRDLVAVLGKLGADGKVLLVDRFDNENLALAARNHPDFRTVDAMAMSVYDVIDCPFVVVSEAALARLMEVLAA